MNLLNSSSYLPIYPSIPSSLFVLSSSQPNICLFVIFTSPSLLSSLYLLTRSSAYLFIHLSPQASIHPCLHFPVSLPLTHTFITHLFISTFHSPALPSDNHNPSIRSPLLSFPSIYLPNIHSTIPLSTSLYISFIVLSRHVSLHLPTHPTHPFIRP